MHINKTAGSSVETALELPHRHRTAMQLIEHVGRRRWEERFSFSVVRNPWDRIASIYHYRVQTDQTGLGRSGLDFDAWLERVFVERDPEYLDNPLMFAPQWEWLVGPDGELAVDSVCRFESIDDDFAAVCRRIGREVALPHVKKSTNRDYRQLYSTRARGLVEAAYAVDAEKLGYSFEG